MKRVCFVDLVPYSIIPVVGCFLLDLTRVDHEPYLIRSDAVSTPYGTFMMEDYVPSALTVLLPFGLGALVGRSSPGKALVLLAISMAIAYWFVDTRESHWVPYVFPAAFVLGGLGACVCLKAWLGTAKSTMELEGLDRGL